MAPESQERAAGQPRTVAEAFGQIVWLLSQSSAHRHLPVGELEGLVMPAITSEQFRIFRFGPLPGLEDARPEQLRPGVTKEGLEQMPLGVALWGQLSEAAEAKVERGERLAPQEWHSGDRLWLLELVSPFSTPENKLAELMLADLVQGPFRGKRFSLHRTDPATGRRDKFTLGADTSAVA